MTNDLKLPLKAKFIKIKPLHWTSCPCVLHQNKIHFSCARAIQSETKGIHSTQLIPHPCHCPSVEYRPWNIPMAHFNPLVAGQAFRYTWCTPGSPCLSDNVSKWWHGPFKHEWNHLEVCLRICWASVLTIQSQPHQVHPRNILALCLQTMAMEKEGKKWKRQNVNERVFHRK